VCYSEYPATLEHKRICLRHSCVICLQVKLPPTTHWAKKLEMEEKKAAQQLQNAIEKPEKERRMRHREAFEHERQKQADMKTKREKRLAKVRLESPRKGRSQADQPNEEALRATLRSSWKNPDPHPTSFYTYTEASSSPRAPVRPASPRSSYHDNRSTALDRTIAGVHTDTLIDAVVTLLHNKNLQTPAAYM